MSDLPTQCKRGHPWPENLKIGKRGYRYCVECARIRIQKRREHLPPTCPQGHEFTPENTMFNSQNSRICRKCLWLRNNTPTPITAEKLRLVFERLNEGETLSSVFGKKSDQSFVVRRLSLVHFMDRHPRIKRKILTLANKNRLAILDRIHAGNRLRAAPALIRNDGASAYEAVVHATASLWEGERGDVMSLMFLAIAEGRLLPKASTLIAKSTASAGVTPISYGHRKS